MDTRTARPAPGTSAFGRPSVTARMRVPRPPARITTGRGAGRSGTNDDGRAVVVEAEADLREPLRASSPRAAPRDPRRGRGGSHLRPRRSACRRPRRWPGRPRTSGRCRVRHARGALALLDPVLVHELAEALRVAGFERLLDLQRRSPPRARGSRASTSSPASVRRRWSSSSSSAVRELPVKNISSRSSSSCMVAVGSREASPRRSRRAGTRSTSARRRRRCTGPACRPAARGGRSRSGRPPRRVARGDVLALPRVERAEQPDRERARRAEAGAGGDVREADDLERRPDLVEPERRPDDRVLDLVDGARPARAPST